MQTQIRYVKSFSKGQITIPKEIRDAFGIGDDFWLKMSIRDGLLIAQPVEKKFDKKKWLEELLNIEETWDLRDEIKESRKKTEKKLRKNAL